MCIFNRSAGQAFLILRALCPYLIYISKHFRLYYIIAVTVLSLFRNIVFILNDTGLARFQWYFPPRSHFCLHNFLLLLFCFLLANCAPLIVAATRLLVFRRKSNRTSKAANHTNWFVLSRARARLQKRARKANDGNDDSNDDDDDKKKHTSHFFPSNKLLYIY